MLNSYFKARDWEKKNKNQIYKNIGAEQMRRVIMYIVAGSIEKILKSSRDIPTNYTIGKNVNEESLRRFSKATKFNEAVHLFGLSISVCTFSKYDIALVPLHLSSIIVQRYNRARIENVLDKRYKK